MLNKVVLMGRFTKDPELRATGTGTSVVSFTLAVDRDFKGQNGERETDFINCVAWKGTAEFISRYFKKGSMAALEGSLQIRPYEDKDEKKRTAAEVVVNNIYFGESKSNAAFNEPVSDVPPASSSGDDEDLPF